VKTALRTGVLLGLSLLIAPSGAGQDASPPDRVAAMRRFDAWVGDWRGSGWSLDAQGRRTEFTSEEHVEPRVGGTVLLLQGRGTAKADDGPQAVTHDGLVLVYFDEHAGQYRWNGHELTSGTMDTQARVFDGGLEWSVPAPGGSATVRFTIRFGDDHWHEFGETSMDGVAWNRFMELNLERSR